MAVKITADNLGITISDILNYYNEEVTREMQEAVKAVGKKTAKKVKELLPVDVPADPSKNDSKETSLGVGERKRYRKNWKSTVSYQDKHDIRVTVHNETDYQLTHLLEFGHKVANQYGPVLGRNGNQKETRPIKHIEVAEEYAFNELGGEVKVRLG